MKNGKTRLGPGKAFDLPRQTEHDGTTPGDARESAVIVRLALPGDSDVRVDQSIEEMTRLADTAGARIDCTVVQRRKSPCPGTLFGKGKIADLKVLCEDLESGMVLVDGELSPKQGSNLEQILGRKVVDRTQLILDIFAQHAHTREGKHQVELAQLQYTLPRLAGRGSLMRQQGGIGVRGPGEQKLEVDRRVIRDRIRRLKKGIDGIRKNRRVQRKRRLENSLGTVALVGYTNAGKSSLINALCGSHVEVADQLFATLDPRSRKCTLPSQREIVLTDTVGFIRHLPHALVAAFRATLEEVSEADFLLIIADASDNAVQDHLESVYGVLEALKVGGKSTVIVYNKIDAASEEQLARLDGVTNTLQVSALTGAGLPQLLARIDERIESHTSRVHLRIPQKEGRLVSAIHGAGRVLSQVYEGDEVVLEAEIGPILAKRVSEYVV